MIQIIVTNKDLNGCNVLGPFNWKEQEGRGGAPKEHQPQVCCPLNKLPCILLHLQVLQESSVQAELLRWKNTELPTQFLGLFVDAFPFWSNNH